MGGDSANSLSGGTPLWTGLTLILVGAVVLLDRLEVLTPDLKTWWPTLLVLVGALQFTFGDRSVPLTQRNGMWLMVAGDWLLLNKLTILTPMQTWPLLLIVAGILIMSERRPSNNNILAGQH